MRKWIVALAVVGAVGLAGGLWFALQQEEGAIVEAPGIELPPGTRVIDLYLPDVKGDLVRETRDILGSDFLEEDVRRTIEELQAGGRSGIHPIPPAAHLLNVFSDGVGEITLNFTDHLRTDHPGGSLAEIVTLRCVVSTVGANFPGVDQVRILIDGESVPTLAGHVSLRDPLLVADYR